MCRRPHGGQLGSATLAMKVVTGKVDLNPIKN